MRYRVRGIHRTSGAMHELVLHAPNPTVATRTARAYGLDEILPPVPAPDLPQTDPRPRVGPDASVPWLGVLALIAGIALAALAVVALSDG